MEYTRKLLQLFVFKEYSCFFGHRVITELRWLEISLLLTIITFLNTTTNRAAHVA